MKPLGKRKRRVANRQRLGQRRRRFEILEQRRLLFAASLIESPAAQTSSPTLEVSSNAFDDSSVLVRLHPSAKSSASGDSETELLPGLWKVDVPEGLSVTESLDFFANYPGMVYVEPNFEVNLAATATDPSYDSLWGLHNTGQTGGVADADIDAQEAWDITTGSSSTIVAVVDTGVDYLHPDLAANMWVNPGEIAGDGIDNDQNGYVDDVHGYNFASGNGNPMDDHNHGTHVAGTIGAVANNGIGIAGVNWDVQIMAVKFLTATGSGSIANAVTAIQYAVDNNASVSNHSWGFNGTPSQALADAIEYARVRDHLVIAAAGNGGGDQLGDDNDSVPFYPGNFQHENLISVAATDDEDNLASFSNYGYTQVDLSAPGVGILSTTRNNSYSTFNGTSMATPHVTGVVALLQSEYPDWSWQQVRDRILDTVDLVPSLHLKTVTGGRLNAAAAVRPDLSGAMVIASSPDSDVMKEVNSVRLTFNEKIDAATFGLDDIVAFEGPNGSIAVTSVDLVPNTGQRQFDIVFDEQAALGDYALTIGTEILDTSGNPMNQNDNLDSGENPGDQFTASFAIIPDTVGPIVLSSSLDGGIDTAVDRVRLTFDEKILAGSFTVDDIVSFSGPGGDILVTDVQSVSESIYEVIFPTQDTFGDYWMVVGGEITDRAGNRMDLDGDGIGGEPGDDSYAIDFSIESWLYADQVVDFSSQYTTTSWSAEQALGVPDTFAYGDIETAWAPLAENGTNEFITVGFPTPLLARGVSIRETFGNGFVRQVEVRNELTGEFVTVSEGPHESASNVPFDNLVTWPQTEFPVDAVRISIDTDHDLDAYEEIDSIQLRGVPVPDTDGARVLTSSLGGSTQAPVDRVELVFDEALADGTFTLADIASFSGPDGELTANAVNRLSGSTYEVTFDSLETFGEYSLVIGPDILDLDGLPMNQDRDEVDGEALEDQFEVSFRLELWQNASTVVDFSSQYSPTSWSAANALGAPDTFVYGDQRTAWAPRLINGTMETLTLGFDTAVLSTGAVIRETLGNGFVHQVEVRDAETGIFAVVFNGPDDSQPGTPVDFELAWPTTSYPVDAIRVTVDTDHTTGYEQIDAVQLRGVVAPDLSGPMVIASTPDTSHTGSLDQIELIFSEPIAEGSFAADDIVSFSGPEGSIEVAAVESLAADRYRVSFAEQVAFGTYSMVVGPQVADLSGNLMDQSGDGIGGQSDDAFELSFDLQLGQYASTVIDFSSQYSTFGWSASAALGAPDTFVYGDQRTAWAPKLANAASETITLGFDTAVLSTGVIIRETYGNGFVSQVEARNADTGSFTVMSTGPDNSQPGAPVDANVSWPMTTFPVDAVRITIDTTHSFTYEQIDSVQLLGIVAPDVTGPSVVASTPEGSHSGSLSEIELTFSEAIATGSFDVEDIVALNGPGGPIVVTEVESLAEDRYRITFDEQTEFGGYSIVVGPQIEDLAGNLMDQNGDGVGGQNDDSFELAFDLELGQYASTVIDFTSQYSTTSWSASDALGAPDTFVYGDQRTTWTPKLANGTTESITLGFETAVLSSGAEIRETYGNGFVRQVEVRDADSENFTVVWNGLDESQPGAPVDFSVAWPTTSFPVDAIRITIDTNHSFTYEQIDSVKLLGIIAPDVTGPAVIATTPEAIQSGPIDQIELIFSEPIAEGSFSLDDIVGLTGPDGTISVTAVESLAADRYRVTFAEQAAFGSYSLTIGSQISDAAGNLMDQSGDGIGGQSDDGFQLAFDLELGQYASTVIDVSSQYSPFSWSASDALGAPDTAVYGDQRTAWAPSLANGGTEFITLGFDTAVSSTGVVIRETYGNGFVRQVEVRDAATGLYSLMFDGSDTSQPGTPVDFSIAWPATGFAVDAVRITIDTSHSFTYEQIDAVQLRGVPSGG